MEMYTVYILQSKKNGRYYIGSTDSFNRRFAEHNSGLVKSTKAYLPWEFAYKEIFETRSDALKREYQLKSWKKRSAIEKLLASSSNG